MSTRWRAGRVRAVYAFIKTHQNQFPVQVMCRILDLREAGETCSKHPVARLMRENALRALHGYRTRR